jgi:hypothetical protein
MTATKIRGPWPVEEQPKPPVPKPTTTTNHGFKVVQVPYTYTPQATGISIYQAEIDALLKSQPGQTAIECDTNAKAKRFAHALQRNINRLKKEKALRVVTRQVEGKSFVWVIKREKTQ